MQKNRMDEAEERELIDSTERGEWTTVGNIEERRAFWQEAAEGVLSGKRERISISIPERDLARLKARAAEEGMPYQTLINSILHKYLDR
ncbi:MAG: DNA-binding protein [Alphaproteobacteria bacterium]|nr:DNA-binding protein [Alphaproteobacteria bacterium]MBU0804399.1 DNA-binding protein [Alphaproteobacteria bacterium]MBU0872456.1 DNA-binding protein [Alphaproteobacteria bacterium]MBU1399436.1 DNA-binding protein [Alphaproteobacteria bacterium]MBU1589822.1 DNA-binding protein [Alphaproteobacteria bacterium]